MKRKITKLEQELIANGWELESKHYEGKHSQKVFAYVYVKKCDVSISEEHKTFVDARVVLDQKRTKVYDVEIKNSCREFVDYIGVAVLSTYLKIVNNEIKECERKAGLDTEDLTDEEIVESAEALKDEA